MSHSDTIKKLPENFIITASTPNIPVAAFSSKEEFHSGTGANYPLFGLQFHPEVYHSAEGKKIIKNFLVNICYCS
jgi:GMP synthase (glutamine-hydrolysing)